jgi:hypothetical protein
MRGAVTIIGGMLAYTALASAFGESPTYLTAVVGLLGSLAAIVWVWWLEMRRSRKDDAKLRADQPAP